ncbi:DUF2304 family protein [Halovenus sp. WSH3]|uniref:DUF2304 family protein n=1 Tax=Halovenus carboxidivorans TaxID=2692199 RepID=A0A6B0TA13_9EURY|nr:DUF2304 domain-containing protein [Halovenus carboxidivorans]MXR51720.1 DUF2304 family protein [Halovenus carboxidivorans]
MVEYTTVNVIAVLVGLVFLGNGLYLVRQGREAVFLFTMSLIVGTGLIVVGIYPDLFQFVATLLGLELKARAILVISNLTLFVVVTYLLNRIGRLYDKVSRLNEQVSLLRNELEEMDD